MKLAEFNYKLLHNILPCGIWLKKWNILQSHLCILCNVPEDYEHVFISCQLLKPFWTNITELLLRTFQLNININFKLVVLGFEINRIKTNENIHAVNTILTLAKYTIFKSWCKYRTKTTFLGVRKNLYTYFKRDIQQLKNRSMATMLIC